MAMLTTDMYMTKRLLRFHIIRDRDAHASWIEAKQIMAASVKEETGAPRTETSKFCNLWLTLRNANFAWSKTNVKVQF